MRGSGSSRGSSDKSVNDLKGQNLGVTELGSGTQTLTMAITGRAGIGADEVHVIPVGARTTFMAGPQQGEVDAGMTTEPRISKVVNSGGGKVLIDLRTPEATRAALGGDYPFISVFMSTDYVNRTTTRVTGPRTSPRWTTRSTPSARTGACPSADRRRSTTSRRSTSPA